MGAVAATIGVVVVDLVGDEDSTAFELGVFDVDTGIQDVGADTFTRAFVVGVGAATGGGAGKTSQSPVSVSLDSVGLDNGVGLNVLDLEWS